MTIEGIDFSWARPRPDRVKAAGKKFIIRYVGPGSSGKLLTATEARLATAVGLDIALVAEGEVRAPLSGYSVGVSHAKLAAANATRAGMLGAIPIYFSIDFDASASQLTLCGRYLDGVRSVLGPSRVGVYGGYKTIDWAVRNSKAVWFWQTYAWSYGKVHSRADILQYRNGQYIDGGQVDLCRALKISYGQGAYNHTYGKTTSAPAPTPVSYTSYNYKPTVSGIAGDLTRIASATDWHRRTLPWVRLTP